MASSSSSISANNKAAIMADKTNTQDPLKCPRCDSSNTKFCYYNNYSLSQPRHFCKACKRYWTRGGTLRNVPVGGGCRKNKRIKRHPSSAATSTAPANPRAQPPQIDLSPASNHLNNNPNLFYSLPANNNNPLDQLNFPFSSFRVSSENTGFDLQTQMNGLGLGFSSGLVGAGAPSDEYKNNGFNASSSFSSAGRDSVLFGSSTSSTMASLLASTLQHQRFSNGFKDILQTTNVPSLMPYEDPNGNGAPDKEVKQEGENGLVWNPNPDLNPNPIEHINPSDPSSLIWNTTWFDPSNMGSSVPSLI